jgi:hypothetical protein
MDISYSKQFNYLFLNKYSCKKFIFTMILKPLFKISYIITTVILLILSKQLFPQWKKLKYDRLNAKNYVSYFRRVYITNWILIGLSVVNIFMILYSIHSILKSDISIRLLETHKNEMRILIILNVINLLIKIAQISILVLTNVQLKPIIAYLKNDKFPEKHTTLFEGLQQFNAFYK